MIVSHNFYQLFLSYTNILQTWLQFLQQYFVCDWAINVDCSTAEGFYSLNDDFGAKIEERSDDQAIEDEDISVLNQMPGIGARAAQKMIATLKGKLIDIISESRTKNVNDTKNYVLRDDIVEILVGLGFKESDAIIKINDVISNKPEIKDDLEEITATNVSMENTKTRNLTIFSAFAY